MFKFIKYVKAAIVFKMIKMLAPAKIKHLSKVRGVRGEVMKPSTGYEIIHPNFWNWYEITGTEEEVEFTRDLLRCNNFRTVKVSVEWGTGVGKCINGHPDCWTASKEI